MSCGIVGWLAATGHEGFDWAAAAETGTAYGTLALALVTWRLVVSASQESQGTLKLAQVAEQEAQTRVTPFVYPWADRAWLAMAATQRGYSVPLRNGGQRRGVERKREDRLVRSQRHRGGADDTGRRRVHPAVSSNACALLGRYVGPRDL